MGPAELVVIMAVALTSMAVPVLFVIGVVMLVSRCRCSGQQTVDAENSNHTS